MMVNEVINLPEENQLPLNYHLTTVDIQYSANVYSMFFSYEILIATFELSPTNQMM